MNISNLNKDRLHDSLLAAENIASTLQRTEVRIIDIEFAIHEAQIITNKLLALKASMLGVPEPTVGGLPEVKVKG